MGEWEETAPKLWVGEGKSAELPRVVFPSSSFEGRSRTQKPPSSLPPHFPEVAFSLSIKPLLNERLYRKIEGEI